MAAPLSRSALRARDALVLEHLSLADAVASAVARRFFPLVEREDLIQVAREALLRSVLRCKAGEPAEPYLRRCISGALQHHLRDRVRLVRIPRRLHEQGQCPLWVTSALMATPLASLACSISWPAHSKKQPGPLMIWRWSSL
jgi:DNA-directed RNA polymerase specialized sigma subunit